MRKLNKMLIVFLVVLFVAVVTVSAQQVSSVKDEEKTTPINVAKVFSDGKAK